MRFTKLVAVEKMPAGPSRTRWRCVCDCGKFHEASVSNLLAGKVRSCGCLKKSARFSLPHKTHGESRGKNKTAEYKTYAGMIQRCYSKNYIGFKYYGGRGIAVDESWRGKKGYETFLSDMGRKPTEKHTIDRINPDGNYSSANCRWATRVEQDANKRNTISFRGETASEASRRLGLNINAVLNRIKMGWDIERAFIEPPRRRYD